MTEFNVNGNDILFETGSQKAYQKVIRGARGVSKSDTGVCQKNDTRECQKVIRGRIKK